MAPVANNLKPITPSLHLGDLHDDELDGYVDEKLEKLTDNPSYPDPFPEKDAAAEAKVQYVAALAKAKDGTKEDTEDKNKKRTLLENAATILAFRCAQLANGNTVMFLSSGFEIKKERTSSQIPDAPHGLEASDGITAGSAHLEFDSMDAVAGFAYELTQKPDDENSWMPVAAHRGGVSTKPETIITGLTPGKRYWFRVIAFNPAGPGSPSDPATRISQ